MDLDVLREYHEGIIALSACLAGEVATNLKKGFYEEGKAAALRLLDIFGEGNFFLELQDHGIPEQRTVNQALLRMSAETRMKRPTIFCCVFRPRRRCLTKIVCVMTADNII